MQVAAGTVTKGMRVSHPKHAQFRVREVKQDANGVILIDIIGGYHYFKHETLVTVHGER